MSARGEPQLVRSELTGAVYVVTAYRYLDDDQIEAIKKYDVTEQFNALAAATADQRAALEEIANTNIGKSSVGRRMRDRARSALQHGTDI